MTAELFGAVVTLTAVCIMVAYVMRSVSASTGKMSTDREDIAYRPYTTEFDIVCTGSELGEVLGTSSNNVTPTRSFEPDGNDTRLLEYAGTYQLGAASTKGAPLPDLSDWAIVVLVDQSGSLADKIAKVAGSVRAIAEQLEDASATVMIAGFTSVGWHGGQSRLKWFREGSPPYPGRLCDLLHVVYSPFETALSDRDLHPLFESGALFENVDGEALRWAVKEVQKASPSRKAILVLSDGAPVDDSTLIANGPNILDRDIQAAIRDIEADSAVCLAAVGISFDVSRYYTNSTVSDQVESIPIAALKLVRELAT